MVGENRESFKKFRKAMLAIDVESVPVNWTTLPFPNFFKAMRRRSNSGLTLTVHRIGARSAVRPRPWWPLARCMHWAVKNAKDERSTWPGGLGALSKRLVEKLQSKFKERMLTGATIIAVRPQRNAVHVSYMQGGRITTVAVKVVIMATSKFITARVVEGLPQAQRLAMQKIRYAPYPVINLIYDKVVFDKGYDTWCRGYSFTDFIVADWTIRNSAGYKRAYNILTCYTPMRETERGLLLTDEGARNLAARVLADVKRVLGKRDADPLEVHVYRRGHPMYTASPATTPGCYRWRGARSIASSSPTPIP
jgi:Flavin containing amine oxidoreductase